MRLDRNAPNPLPLSTLIWAALAAMCMFYAELARADVPRVVASVKPVHSLAALVMDGAGAPDLLVKGSASPHTFALKPSDASTLSQADLVLWVGPELEQFLEKPLGTLSPKAVSIAFMDQPELNVLPVRGRPEQRDAHIWLDPRNAKAMVGIIARELERLDPVHAEIYSENAAQAVRRLNILELVLDEKFAPIGNRRFFTYHDALEYLRNRYELPLIGSVVRSPEEFVSARRISGIRADIFHLGPFCLFTNPPFEQDVVELIVRNSATLRAAALDPEGTALMPGPAFYFDLMRGIADDLTSCLVRSKGNAR